MTRIVCFILAAMLLAAPAMANDPDSLVFVFQKQKDPAKVKEHADRVAAFLTEELKMPVRTFVPSDYSATVQALVSKKADIAYVSAIPFMLARRDAGATVLLAEQRADATGKLRTDYDSVFVVRKDSPLKNMDDLVRQASDTRMVFTSSTSTSGYIMAYRRLVHEGLLKAKQDPATVFKSVRFGGSYTQALEQVIDGRGDVCAVSFYTIEGPAADVYLPKEKRDQLRVLARTPNVPTHLICARGGLSKGLQQRVTEAMLKLAKEHPDLIADVYGARNFVKVDGDEHVAAEALKLMDLPVEGLVH